MKLFLHNQLRSAQKLDATRVLITSDNGTPLALVIDHGGGVATVASIENPEEFKTQLRLSGITQTLQVTDIVGPDLTALGAFSG